MGTGTGEIFKPFLTAEWRDLAMLNYEIEPAVLAPYLPGGVELDTWHGRTFASLVGFLFLNARPLGVSIPYHRDFEEVNLRFYVRRKGPEGWRRGVVFVKEIVPRWAIAMAARLAYGERYVAIPMRRRVEMEAHGLRPEGRLSGEVEYAWRFAGRWNRLFARTQGEPQPLVPGSEEAFITEHYWGYAARRGGRTIEYRVEHPSWSVWQVSQSAAEIDIRSLYGPQFHESLSAPPASAFVADGSAVTVYQGNYLAL
jgi:uncharacterized protein YqjF (DUF2071 family)